MTRSRSTRRSSAARGAGKEESSSSTTTRTSYKEPSPPPLAPAPNITPRSTRGRTPRAASSRKKQPWEESDEDDLDNHNQHEDDEDDFVAPKYTPGRRGRPRKAPPPPPTDDDEDTSEQEDDNDDSDASVNSDDDEEEEEEEEEDEDELDDDMDEEESPRRSLRMTIRVPQIPKYLTEEAEKEIPQLTLPDSSDDLVIKKEHVLDALSVYEVLRHFSKCLRLTPFRFEDFCASLVVDEQNNLLSEIHMSLLKALIREDEVQGTHYVPTDLKDSVVINFFFMDHYTWPESLRLFLSTDLKTNDGILKECFEDPQSEGKEYPFVPPGIRLKLLRHLTDLFLQTGPPREDVFNEGVIKHDDHCRYCQRLGELICCEQCPATYHLGCIDPPLNEVPGDDWICPVCEANTVSGISDCISSYEKSGLLCRQEPLGWDRHGRRYWFLTRRIVVESDDGKECWYYSTKLQLQKLIDSLDGEDLEADLVRTIEEAKEEIHRQFDITEQLTNSARQGRKSYIIIDNERLTKELEEKIKKEEEEKKAAEEKSKMEVDDGDSKSIVNGSVNGESSKSNDTSNIDMKEEGDKKDESSPENDVKKTIQTRLKTGSIQLKPINLDPLKRVTPNGTPDVTGATGGDIYVYSKDGETLTRVSKRHLLSTSSLLSSFVFKLGMEIPPMTRSYVNYYNVMSIALNRHQHQEERDRRRHLSHKFSLTPASEFKWQPITAITGSRNVLLSTLRQTIIHLEQQLPPCLLHPNWPVHRENWEKAVKMCTTAKDFSLALCILESSMKPVLMTGAWNEALGFTHFHRTTQQEREEAKKGERREGKSTRKSKADQSKGGEGEGEEDVTEGLYKLNQYVHYVFGKLKHQIWKQKGEEYRLSGKGGWSWLSKTRRFRYKRYSKQAPVQIIELTDEQQDQVKNAALINISQELRAKPAERTFYSTVYTGSWNVSSTENYSTKYKNNMKIIDGFLERRQIQKEIEEREAKIKKKEEAETSKMDVDEETGLGDPILSKCYSPSCDGTGECYSVTCVREQKLREEKKQKEEEERKAKEQQEKDSETSEVAHCQDRVSLHKIIRGADGVPQLVKRIAVKSKTLSKGSLPPCHRFITKVGKQTSILVLPDYELKKLARCASMREVTGFNYNCKLNPVIWPYHTTPRPVLRTTWLYRNQNLFTIHSVALQFKILWASVRWDDLQQKPPPSGANTITTETEVITTEILKRREVPPFGVRSEYLIRRIIVPIELPSNKPREKSAPIRSGLRERKRAESPQNRGPSMTESWHAEEELEIWELKQFGEKVEKALKEQKERERIAELRAMRPQSTADRQRAEELLRQKIGTAKGLTNTPAGVKTRISNLIQSKVAQQQQAQGSYAMIKTVGGQMFKVPITALAGKTVGQTIVIKTGQSGANNLTTTAATIMSMHAAPPVQTTPKTGTTVTQSITTTGPQATIAPSTPQQVIIRAPNIPAGQTVVIRQPTVTPAGQRVQIIRPAATAGTPVAGRTLVSTTPGQQGVVPSPQQQAAGTPTQMVTIPVKLANGSTHLIQIPVSMIGANQQLQIAVQPTPQAPGQQTIQIIATPQQPQPQPAAAAGGQQIRIVGTPAGTPRIIQIRQQTQPIVVATSTAQNVSAPPPTSVQQQAATAESVVKSGSILVQQSPANVSTGQPTTPSTSTAITSPTTPSGESPSSSGFVLTSQVTSEILRNAVMNANLSTEMQQKLLAAQKMYSETNYSQVLTPVSPSKVTPKRTSGRERTPKRLDPDMIKTPVFPTSYDGKREPDPQAVARGKASALKRKLVAEELERQRKEKEAIWNALPPEQREEMEREDDVRSIMKFMLDRVERNERLELKRKRNREQAHQHRWKVATSRLESILHRQTEMLKNEMKAKKINFEVEYGKEVDVELENLLGRKITKEEIPATSILKPIVPDQVVIAAPATTHVTPLTEHSQRSGSTSIVKSAPPPPSVTPIQQRVPPITISADQIPKPPQLTPSPAKKAAQKVTTKESPKSSKILTVKKTPITASSTPKKRTSSGTLKSTGMKLAPSASANPQPSTSSSQPAIPSTSSEGEPAAKKKLYCICQTPYDTARLMVGCDSCNNWFHADCIGLSESDVEQLDAYVCKNCQEEDDQVNGEFPSVDVNDIVQEEVVVDSLSKGRRKDGSGDELELYCICRQPYDESQFYICCDSCQDWFHGRCVGVLQKEADKIDVYVCPNCQRDSAINYANLKLLDVVDMANLKILLNEIKKHRSSWPFLEPVDAKEVPDYYKVIKEPMDLKKIEHKLSTKQYTKLAQFIGDVTKMFDNCRYYNGPKTTFYNCAESLEGFFVNKIKAFREKMA